jgi:hypothetical protein
MGKVLAFEQEWFVPLHGQSIRKAVPKVEVSRVTAAASESAVRLSRELCLLRRHRFNLDGCLAQQFIKATAQRGAAIAVY